MRAPVSSRPTIREYLRGDTDPRLQQFLHRLGELADTPIPPDYGYQHTARWIDQLVARADQRRGARAGTGWVPASRRRSVGPRVV
jgi:hypothetical protein